MSDRLEITVPRMNPNDDHAVLVRWNVASGAQVLAGQSLATLETTKATFDVETPRNGYVFFDLAPKTMVAVGSRLAWISDDNLPPPMETESGRKAAPAPVQAGESRFTRKALQLMRQRGMSEGDFAGVSGRVEAADVERVARARGDARKPGQPPSEEVDALDQPPAKMIEIQALGEVYRSAIPSMVASSISCERSGARLRALAGRGGPISLLELVIHDAARILGDFPELNGYFSEAKAWHYRAVGIGFAVNIGRSLRVPVVHRAAELPIIEIARAVRDLSLKYMRDELTMDDLTGGTFTVTDLSSQGVEFFVPVLNSRQSAILGLCAERPGSGRRDLVLAFDHRMSDGMRAASFLARLRDCLESDSPD